MFTRIISNLSGNTITAARQFQTSPCLDAARKGTRMKREAIKKAMKRKKVEVAKKEFIPVGKRKELEKIQLRKSRKEIEIVPTDNVYIAHYFKTPENSVKDAMVHHRQICHPTSFNQPEALIRAFIELNLQGEKKSKGVGAFSGILNMPVKFTPPTGSDRNLLVMSEVDDVKEQLYKLGIEHVVGGDLKKLVKTGKIDIDLFSHIICDISLLPELSGMRPVLMKKFPTVNDGTAVVDVVETVKKFQTGVQYTVVKNKYDPTYATIDCGIGRISMTDNELEQNLNLLLKNVVSHNTSKNKNHKFIQQVQLRCSQSVQSPKIKYEVYI